MDGKPADICVEHILDDYAKGKDREYLRLLVMIRSPVTERTTLLSIIQQLQCVVSQLNNSYHALINAVLTINWLVNDQALRQAYVTFLINLTSAHPVYVAKVLKMLVCNLSIQKLNKETPVSLSDETSKATLSAVEMYPIVHGAIQSLLQIIPVLPRYLLIAAREDLPIISSPKEIQNDFIQNLFHISTYLPELRKGLLEIIVHRITEIDVHCPRSGIFAEADDDMESEDEQISETLFEMDDVQEPSQNAKDSNDPEVTEIAAALDCLMCTLFRFVEESCHETGVFKMEPAQQFYQQFLRVFEKIILTTYCSNHVQFVIFYLCSFRKLFADNFLDFLWKKFSNPGTAMTLRKTSASYMASFLSRAKFIPLGTVTACLDLMTKWIHAYIHNQEESIKDSAVHGPFYSLCQATFYTIIYRYKELLTSRKGLQYMMGLNLERIISCRLNPLMYCLPSVVNIFATIARKYQIAFCYTIMERNARNVSIIKANSFSKADIANPLDTFFPFDPYLLPRSAKLIHPLYKEWEGVKVMERDKQKQDEEEEDYSQYEEHLQEVPLGLTQFSLTTVSPGFMGP